MLLLGSKIKPLEKKRKEKQKKKIPFLPLQGLTGEELDLEPTKQMARIYSFTPFSSLSS
jgi:hypothetical protein